MLIAASRQALPARVQDYLAEEQELLAELKAGGSTLAEWLAEVYPEARKEGG